jgi:predicted transcriptional regulator
MEENVFEVLKTIRTSEHSVTIDDIVLSTQINESYVCSAIEWLMEMGVLQKDKSCVEEDRYFTTNNTEIRQLIDEMINVVA